MGESGPRVMTVLGPVDPLQMGFTDAHSHLWIEPVEGAQPGAPVLNQRDGILTDLVQFHGLGGGAVIDCQPGGCGRNARVLAELSRASQVRVVACTGFHRRRYYPSDFWLWSMDPAQIAAHFVNELETGARETLRLPQPVRAGFVKAAFEASLEDTELGALEGAARAVAQTACALLIHTERGAAVEKLLERLYRWQVRPQQIILCHMDKRPDFTLHAGLVRAGILLEYDTFYRPLYQPDAHLWPLIERMAAAGLEGSLALATDLAPAGLWRSFSPEFAPGLPGFIDTILPRLRATGIPETAIQKMMGGNVARRLATVKPDSNGL